MSHYTRSRLSTALYSPLIENGYEISNEGKFNFSLFILFEEFNLRKKVMKFVGKRFNVTCDSLSRSHSSCPH